MFFPISNAHVSPLYLVIVRVELLERFFTGRIGLEKIAWPFLLLDQLCCPATCLIFAVDNDWAEAFFLQKPQGDI